MTDAQTDARFMARAIQLARLGWRTTTPNPRVGCVLVAGSEILGEGWHERAGGPHAEVAALGDARTKQRETRGATAYVTLEPCCVHGRTPPCTDTLIEAGVSRVVVGATDPNPKVDGGGLAILRAADLEVHAGCLETECEALNPGFRLRMTAGRPRFRVKMAASLDGRTAAANGESQWITGPSARRDVHALRAESCAVVTGIGTLLADDPHLNARDVGAARQPARIVLDSGLRTSTAARLLDTQDARIILTASDDPAARATLEASGARVIRIEADASGRLDLHALAAELGRLEYNEVLVEAGATLAGAFVAEGLADELILYMAPQLLGNGGRAMLDLPDLRQLSQRIELEILDIRSLGADWRIIARPRPAEPGAVTE